MQSIYSKLKQNIEFLVYYLAFYYNQYYVEAFMLKERDKVYLL